MSFWKKIFRAFFVLPFSAGNIEEPASNSLVKHDGSIAGLVILTSSVAIICEVFMFGTDAEVEDVIHVNMFFLILDLFSCLAILSCVFISIYTSARVDNKTERTLKLCDTIRLKFLWLFSLACIVYAVLNFAYHIDCKTRSLPLRHIEQSISFDIVFVVYCLIQTAFLTHFSQVRFKCHTGIYYGLLILFISNIAIICRVFAASYQEIDDFRQNVSMMTIDNKTMCQYNSSIFTIVDKASFLEPAFYEYSLLALLFISEMWPIKITSDDSSLIVNYLYNESRESNAPPRNNTQSSPLLPARKNERPDNSKHRSRKVLSMSIGIVIIIPSFVLYGVHLSQEVPLRLASSLYMGFETTLFFLFLCKCFYDMQNQCLPVVSYVKMTTNDYLLLLSSVGAMVYYTIKLISDIWLAHSSDTDSASIYYLLVRILATYFQTVFLLQMKNYSKILHKDSWASIEYTCLLLSFENLCTWGFDSVVSAQSVFVADASYKFYEDKSSIMLFTFVFPFLTFYRFLCFVSFYGLYTSLK